MILDLTRTGKEVRVTGNLIKKLLKSKVRQHHLGGGLRGVLISMVIHLLMIIRHEKVLGQQLK